jgi:hypothetical protein
MVEEKMRIARERANQAKALIGKQYLSLKHGIQPWRRDKLEAEDSASPYPTEEVEMELSKRSSRNFSNSFSSTTSPFSSFDASTAPTGSLRKYKQRIYRNMSPQERYEEMKQATEDIEKLKQEEKRREGMFLCSLVSSLSLMFDIVERTHQLTSSSLYWLCVCVHAQRNY